MMYEQVNLVDRLQKERRRIVADQDFNTWVDSIFLELDDKRSSIVQEIANSDRELANSFDFNVLDTSRIFHLDHIRTISINYRLRFLDAQLFKGDLPVEAITEVRELETLHNTSLKGFKIMAPSKLFVLKKTDDPLLFAPMGNGYFYLIHKWGNDLHPLRKALAWPTKNAGTVCTTLLILCLLLTLMSASFIFNGQAKGAYVFMLFLFYFKFAVGFLLFYGISLGKNFNEFIWRSPHDKLS